MARLNGHAWLSAPPPRELLLTAARAALFEESIARGKAELVVSADALAGCLGVDPRDAGALRGAVDLLPAYR